MYSFPPLHLVVGVVSFVSKCPNEKKYHFFRIFLLKYFCILKNFCIFVVQ